MGKSAENNGKTSKKNNTLYRKSLLGSSTLAIFLQPNQFSGFPLTSDRGGQKKVNGEKGDDVSNFSAKLVFDLLKDANKIMVKGAKLYESLSEMRLCGWINPYTLLLSGLSEDMKIVKRAWVKRHLKNPEEFFITDVGKFVFYIFYIVLLLILVTGCL